jgi:transposase
MLSPELQAEILAMHFGQKKGSRAIALTLGLGRKSVRRVIDQRKVTLAVDQSARGSIVDTYKPMIAELLSKEPRIPSNTILQKLREVGYLGGYTVVKDYVQRTRQAPSRSREAFLQLEFAPGECAQVDWGEFGDVFGDGAKVHCFLMVLCHSRLLYIEFTQSEKFEEFIRCHENAFRFFGGLVPQECWYDNLRSAVTERMGSLVRFNSRFLAYMGHHGIRPHACNPARGNEKGRVEGGVKLIRSSFWPARKFKDFEDLCRQGNQWRDETANQREHRATRKIPALHFESEEKKCLRPMNPYPYDTDEVFPRVVPPTFHIAYDTNQYSVPWTLVGMSVTLRVNSREISVFYNERFVTRHDRCYKKQQTISRAEHSEGLLARKPGGTREGWQLHAVKSLGLRMGDYLNLLKSGRRSIRNEVARILALATVYGEVELHEVASELLDRGIIGVENLELALKSRNHPAETELQPAPLNFQKAKLNRVVPTVDLRRYDALLFESTRQQENLLTPREGKKAPDRTHPASIQEGEVENGTSNDDEGERGDGPSNDHGAPPASD